ncbi:hypothetical protein T484DRAFT_1844359, partial [Baffinella frigidus]
MTVNMPSLRTIRPTKRLPCLLVECPSVGVVPGGAITISGISGIEPVHEGINSEGISGVEPVQSPGTPKCMIDFLQLLPECSVDLAAAGLYETATFGTRGMFSDAAVVVAAAAGAPVIPAGVLTRGFSDAALVVTAADGAPVIPAGFSDAALVVTAADGAPVIPAGVPFTFSFQLFNPKDGQEAPALHAGRRRQHCTCTPPSSISGVGPNTA